VRKRVNSTGRRRIERRHVRIDLRQGGNPSRTVVAARFLLDDLDLSPEGRIVVEPYRHGFVERLDYGTVASPGADEEPVLQELGPEGLLFRVKVVEPGTGRLLALARRLGAGDDAQPRRELFRVRLADLGQEVWRVELETDAAPWLVLNNRIPDVAARQRTPGFRAQVLPAAMRTVLLELWRQNENPDEDESAEESWTRRWFDFAENMAGDDCPDPEDAAAMLTWIDRACAAFASQHGLTDELLRSESRESEP
jgi:hypothetical protein